MAARLLACLVLIGTALMTERPSRSEVIHGFQVLRPIHVYGFPDPHLWDDGFDFATQCTTCRTPGGARAWLPVDHFQLDELEQLIADFGYTNLAADLGEHRFDRK